MAIEEADGELSAAILAEKRDENALKRAELEDLNTERKKAEKSLEHLYSDRLNEIISLEQYISYNKSYSAKLDEINMKISEIQKEIESTESAEDIKKSVREFLEKKYIDRQILENLVDRIEFGEINPETGNPILKIFWNLD